MMKYSSAFAAYISGMIEQKRALGYKYESQTSMLKRFDQFCLERYPNETTLSREIMLAWAQKRPGEHPATLQSRMTPVRELSKYMLRLGINVYVFPKGMQSRVPRYVPHIYSNDELKRIFVQTDRCHYCSEVPYRHLVMPLFFRLLYCSGMRVSEARLLKLGNVDLTNGVITIVNAKLDKHRQLPVSPELLEHLKNYSNIVHQLSTSDDWFFPGYGAKPMTMGNVTKNLRKFLWQAGISHGGRGKGPRTHDFRHTFSVHCLRRWVLENKDINAYLPVLQAYLGHVSLSDTAYYLHLTADLFPNIVEQLESSFSGIIPKLEVLNEGN
jgi:integrase